MTIPDFLDPIRLEVDDVTTSTHPDGAWITVYLRLQYAPWEPSPGQAVLMEHANALSCVRAVLTKGGMIDV